MKSHLAIMLTLAQVATLLNVACSADNHASSELVPPSSLGNAGNQSTDHDNEKRKMKITIGSSTFWATLADNPTSKALKGRLPLSLKMTRLNDNEIFADLAKALPTEPVQPGTIREGDVLLYGNKTLVVFYKTFKTSYSYTRLGRIDDSSGLDAALTSDNIDVVLASN